MEAYDVDSLEPDQVDFLLYKMVKNRSLVQDYYRWVLMGLAVGCDVFPGLSTGMVIFR